MSRELSGFSKNWYEARLNNFLNNKIDGKFFKAWYFKILQNGFFNTFYE